MFPDLDQLKTLISEPEPPCITIYLPTERSVPGKASKHLKSKLREAHETLLNRGWSPAKADQTLSEATALMNSPDDWAREGAGAAIFLKNGEMHTYALPFEPSPELVIAHRPFLLPLLPVLSTEGHFYILAISLHGVRLFEATRDSVSEVEIADVPQTMQDVVGHDYEEKHLQMRSGVAGGAPGGQMMHGHGAASESEKKREATQFLHRVDSALKPYLRRSDAPIVLVAVDYLQAIFREVTDIPNVLPEGVSGSPDDLDARALHEKSWPVAEKVFLQPVEEAKEQARELAGTEKGSDDLGEVLGATIEGRVDRLLIARGARAWGTYDSEHRVVSPDDGTSDDSDELLNRAVSQCLGAGGQAFLVDRGELPDGSPVAAVFRY
jgi:hypothetical protein